MRSFEKIADEMAVLLYEYRTNCRCDSKDDECRACQDGRRLINEYKGARDNG